MPLVLLSTLRSPALSNQGKLWWKLLREIPGSGINIADNRIHEFYLDLLKAMYGLNDAPLCWQLFLADFYVKTLEAIQSSYDE